MLTVYIRLAFPELVFEYVYVHEFVDLVCDRVSLDTDCFVCQCCKDVYVDLHVFL
jgi:hypothetical protein